MTEKESRVKTKVFVDGESGTTGLEIHGRLAGRADIELLAIDPARRRDPAERERLLNAADVDVLCLPDDAAREAVAMVHTPSVRILDASTAHRTAPGWVYGLPELGRREQIRTAARVAVPGCHATGFNALVAPLVQGGVIGADYPVCCQSVSGYSGGGKKMIARYQGARTAADMLHSPRFYALGLGHKHLPEMQAVSGLNRPPLFTPIVGDYYRGMLVAVPLRGELMRRARTPAELAEYYSDYYRGEPFIRVMPAGGGDALDAGCLDAMGCNGTNRLEIFTFGREGEILAVARLDNLGKGASGAAVQCLNIMRGRPENEGLPA